ncbi:hypothetical protein ACQ4PT_047129 [Festuca glaucescens]
MATLSEMGAGPVPTEDFLNTLAQTLNIKPRGRSWDCPLCKHRNDPVDNLLFKIAPFKCSNPNINCPAKSPATPEMSITDCIVNNVRTDFVIRDQGPHPTCAAQALLHAMDAKLRIHGSLYGRTLSQPLSDIDLFSKYHTTVGAALGEEIGAAAKQRVPCLLQIAQEDGVEYITPLGSVPTGRVLKLTSWFYVSVDDSNINFIIRLIASGFPLVSGMRTGRCFKMANDGELYLCPRLEVNHAIVLIGCCVKSYWLPAQEGTTKQCENVLFKARDSKGERVHKSGQRVATGGDIYLLPEDLSSKVFGFHLQLPTWMG